MPPIDPRARYPQGMQRISIPTLSGGVGRQAPTKRAVNEAEDLDNVLCTLERSAEKRPPTEFIRRYTNQNFNVIDTSNTFSTLNLPNSSPDADYFFYWLQISDAQRYLVVLDYKAAAAADLFRVYRTSAQGFYECTFLNITVTADMFAYFTYGNDDPKNKASDIFKGITVGPQLLILNSLVQAGYTSDLKTFDGTETITLFNDSTTITPAVGDKYWCEVGMDGDFKSNPAYEDGLGRKLTYFTSTPVDTKGDASIYVPFKYYIRNDQVFAVIDALTDMAPYGYDHTATTPSPAAMTGITTNGLLDSQTVLIFTCINDGVAQKQDGENAPIPYFDQGDPPVTTPPTVYEDYSFWKLRPEVDGGPIAKYVAVEDWDYPEASKAYLGGSLEDFSEFQFPPKESDYTTDNAEGGAVATDNNPAVIMTNTVTKTLAALYDDINSLGNGKIYSLSNSYAGEPPGFYIIKNFDEKPYVRLIRTPYEYSVLDAKRFPKILNIESIDSSTKMESFHVNNFELEERRSGDIKTNPGPEAFKNGRQSAIQSMAFFRDRLFLSVDDTVFSSRIGDFSDFWAENPSFISDTDPIDVRLSTNKYAPVTTMTPFQQYLFVNTGSDIQFTLSGSENTITPTNAVISPTAFYSTAPLIDPVLLGSQIYFFAPQRAYIYFNDSTVSINQAVEVSLQCPSYLPQNWGQVCIIPGYDSMAMLDADNPKFVYMYTNRYSGAEVAQNAFFRYIFDTDVSYVDSFDNDLFYVMKYEYLEAGVKSYKYYLERQKFREEDHAIPLIDHQIRIKESDGGVTYDSNTDRTTIVANQYPNLNVDSLYIEVSTEDPLSGTYYELSSDNESGAIISVVSANGTLTIVMQGNYVTATQFRTFVLGSSYSMRISLSPQYVRDDRKNAVEGILSLRSLSLQHFNTGSYRVEKIIRGRRVITMQFSPEELDELGLTGGFNVPLPLYETKGETFSKIMGYAAETQIEIISDYPAPVNITQIELKGRFTGKSSGFVR